MVLAMRLFFTKNQLIRVIASLPQLGSAPQELQVYTARLGLTNMSICLYLKQGYLPLLDDTITI
jgi:hypothetical protein